MRCVIVAEDGAAWRRTDAPGGLSLLERQLGQLAALGHGPPLVLVVGDGSPAPPADVPAGTEVRRVAGSARGAFAVLAAAVDLLPDDFLVLAADHLVDRRVLDALARRPGPVVVSMDGTTAVPVGRARAADVRRHGEALATIATRLPLAALDPYVPELRGRVAPYCFPVRSRRDRQRAWRVLLDHAQKRTLDLPGRYLDAPFENWLVRRLAPTALTPNQVTAATLVLAAGVALLFLHGWLRLGVVGALVVGILDGVDGKLARVKLATSRLGRLEHVGDFFYENAWYLALAGYFAARGGAGVPAGVGVALVACDLADNLLYLLVQWRTGRPLDERTALDRRIRMVAGRRNVYVLIFAVGFFAGHAAGAFVLAAAWAAATVVVHAVRALQALAATPSRRAAAQVPAIESARALVVER